MAGEILGRVLALAVRVVRRGMHDPRARSLRLPRVGVDVLDADEDRRTARVVALHDHERAVTVDQLHAVLGDSQAHREAEGAVSQSAAARTS